MCIRDRASKIKELEAANLEAKEQIAIMTKIQLRLNAEVEELLGAKKVKLKKVSPGRKTAKKTPASKTKKKSSNSSKSSGSGSGKDDLTLINGIGPVYQKTLNKAGVNTFEQMAAWTKADVKRVEEEIGFGNRITDEGWVKQAKSLLKAKRKK